MINIETQIENGIYEIIVEGDIDASSSIHLDNALETAVGDYKKILVNLENLSYISSAGLGVFIARLEDMGKDDLSMVLFGMNEKVQNVFKILGLEELLNIQTDKARALQAIEA